MTPLEAITIGIPPKDYAIPYVELLHGLLLQQPPNDSSTTDRRVANHLVSQNLRRHPLITEGGRRKRILRRIR